MLRHYLTLFVTGLLVGTIWLTPAIADIINADTVDGRHASKIPTAGYLYPLNGSKKFPNSVLYTGHRKGLDADTLDGKHSYHFYTRQQADARYVSKTIPSFSNQERHISIPPAAWATAMQGLNASDDVGNRHGIAYSITGTKAMVAPLQLPDGAKITGIAFRYNDTDASADISLELRRVPWYSSITETVATVSSVGDPGWASRNASVNSHTVDNNYAYYLHALGTSPSKQISNVSISHTVSTP